MYMYKENISLQRKNYLSKRRKNKTLVTVCRIGIVLVLFAAWEIAADIGAIDTFITSKPSRMVQTAISLFKTGDLLRHIGVTCLETVVGFLIGTVTGTLTAILLWSSKTLASILEPYLIVLNSLPKIALGPIFIIWIGSGKTAIIVMALTISLIVTVLEVYTAFSCVSEEKIKLIRCFGGSKLDVLLKVVLPSNVPAIVNALKVNVGLSWVGVIVGEFLVSKEGLGYLIVYGSQVFQLDLVMTSTLILAMCATAMYQCVAIAEKRLIKQSNYL